MKYLFLSFFSLLISAFSLAQNGKVYDNLSL